MRPDAPPRTLSDGSEVHPVQGAWWRYLVVPARARLATRPGGRPALTCVRYDGDGVVGAWLVFDVVLAVSEAVSAELAEHLRPWIAARHAEGAPEPAPEEPTKRRWKVVSAPRGVDPTAPVPGGPPPEPVLDGNAWWRGQAEVWLDGVPGSPWTHPVSGAEARVSVGVDLPPALAAAVWAALHGQAPAPAGGVSFDVAIEPTRAPLVGAPERVRVHTTLAELIEAVPLAQREGCLRRVHLDEPEGKGMRVELVAETDWHVSGIAAIEVALEVEGEEDEVILLTPDAPTHTRFRRRPVRAVRWRVHHHADAGARAPWTPWMDLESSKVIVRPPAVVPLEVQLDASALDFDGLVLQAMVRAWLEDEAGRKVRELGVATLRAGASSPTWTGLDTGAAAWVVFRVDYVLEGGQVLSGPPRGVSWQVPIKAGGVSLVVPEPPVRQVRVPVVVESASPLVQALVTWHWGDRGGTWHVKGMVRLTSEQEAGEFSYVAPFDQLDQPYHYQVIAVRADGSAWEGQGSQLGMLRLRVPRRPA